MLYSRREFSVIAIQVEKLRLLYFIPIGSRSHSRFSRTSTLLHSKQQVVFTSIYYYPQIDSMYKLLLLDPTLLFSSPVPSPSRLVEVNHFLEIQFHHIISVLRSNLLNKSLQQSVIDFSRYAQD